MRKDSKLSADIKFHYAYKTLVGTGMDACTVQPWMAFDGFQENTELSNSGVECLKAGQGRFAFKPERTICGLCAIS